MNQKMLNEDFLAKVIISIDENSSKLSVTHTNINVVIRKRSLLRREGNMEEHDESDNS